MDSIHAFYHRAKSNSRYDSTERNQILVCATGHIWDVVIIIDDEEVEFYLYENKSDAIKAARSLFNSIPKIKKLDVESRSEFKFKTIRTR